jgi:N-acetylglutamate synthase-like GNAT family acetyltransferase
MHPNFRGKGVASKLIKHYIEWIRNLKNEGVLCVDRICLMSRTKLSNWYSKLGFKYIGKSKVPCGNLAIFSVILFNILIIGTEEWNDHVLLL